jgi:hypothetical protein
MYLIAIAFRPALEPIQLQIQKVPGSVSMGIKRSEHEADYTSPPSSEVENA